MHIQHRLMATPNVDILRRQLELVTCTYTYFNKTLLYFDDHGG